MAKTGVSAAATGAVGAVKAGEVRREVVLVDRGYIVARDAENVYVWNPAALAWEAKLETGGKCPSSDNLRQLTC